MNQAQDLYTDLLSLLREMLSHYRHLLELSQRERQAVTTSALATLLETTTQKETLVLELSMMEEGRQLLLRKIAQLLEVPPTELTLARLGVLAPQAFTAEFQRCRTDLGALVQEISQVNERNTMLLSSSLDCVRLSLGLLSRLLEPARTYTSSGQLESIGAGGKVLYKCV